MEVAKEIASSKEQGDSKEQIVPFPSGETKKLSSLKHEENKRAKHKNTTCFVPIRVCYCLTYLGFANQSYDCTKHSANLPVKCFGSPCRMSYKTFLLCFLICILEKNQDVDDIHLLICLIRSLFSYMYRFFHSKATAIITCILRKMNQNFKWKKLLKMGTRGMLSE